MKNTSKGPLKRLWSNLTPRRQRQFGAMLFLIVLTSFTELLTLGAVIPFLSVLINPQKVYDIASLKPVFKVLGVTSAQDLPLLLSLGFLAASLIAGLTRLLYLWAGVKLSSAIGADIGLDIYRKTLYQPYSVHVMSNSSEVITGITAKANSIVYSTLLPILTIAVSVISLTTILLAVVAINPQLAIVAFVAFGAAYFLIALNARKRLKKYGEISAVEQTQQLKALQEGLGGIRDVLIDGSQNFYAEIYRKSDRAFRHAQASIFFIGASPRYSMEMIAMILMTFFAYFISVRGDGLAGALPILGAMALGAQRMLPVMQQGYAAWVSLRAGHAILDEVLQLIERPLPDYANHPITERLPFEHALRLEGISFSYLRDTAPVLQDISLEIRKGSRIGFMGKTGSGKSTLLDLIMGLLTPNNGRIIVDGKVLTEADIPGWQKNIAHVPQSIYLADSTIAENIAFGIPPAEIDMEKVKSSAEKAQLGNHIESLSHGYHTFVGERGIRLSGGQRQRIGIARALYKGASVIIFDEATSALDTETERAVMEAIECLSTDVTILIIAHRLSTIEKCDDIYELQQGKIIKRK